MGGSSEDLSEKEYVVEEILDHSARNLFHVKWVGFPHSDNTWEPLEHVIDCEQFKTYLQCLDQTPRKNIEKAVKQYMQQKKTQKKKTNTPKKTKTTEQISKSPNTSIKKSPNTLKSPSLHNFNINPNPIINNNKTTTKYTPKKSMY